MKLIKELQKKAEDLRGKVALHSADMSLETPLYTDQKRQVSEWIQAHSDVLKEILKLRIAVQRTNLATNVDLQLGGKTVTKSIAEWIHRRRDLATLELEIWGKLTDRGIKEGQLIPASIPGAPHTPVTVRRYYDPTEKDAKMELYRAEPGVIDRTLEVVNATTEVID